MKKFLRTNELDGNETTKEFLERVSKNYEEYETIDITLHFNDARLVHGTAKELLKTKSNDWRMNKTVTAITFYDCDGNYEVELLIK